MLPSLARMYLLTSLEGHITLLTHHLGGLAEDDPRWNARPDPERFSLREVIAHLAAVEEMSLQRAHLTRDQDDPQFPSPGSITAVAEERAVAFTAAENLVRFCDVRAQYVALLRDLDDEQWQRAAEWQLFGALTPFTLETQAVFILAHTGYHLKQVVEWLA